MTSIMQTLQSLYAIGCEAQRMANEIDKGEKPETEHLRSLLQAVSDRQVLESQDALRVLLTTMANVSHDLKHMQILSLTTSADPINNCIWFNIDAKFGNSVVTFATIFSKEGTQNVVDGLNMALLTLQPGKNVHVEGGNA